MPAPHVTQAAEALREGIGALTRRLRQVRDDDDLSWGESAALAMLARDGAQTSAELARTQRISPQSMGAILRTLEAEGFLERTADPQDGRRILIAASPEGRRHNRRRQGTRSRQLAEALAAEFSDAEIARLAAAAPLLVRLAERL